MKLAGIQIRRRFFVSVGLMVAITGIWLYWNRFNRPVVSASPSGQPTPFVRIAGAGQGLHDKVLEERAEYFDPTPLFLPTSRNFQQGALPGRVIKQPGQVFPDFPPIYNFTENSLPDYGVAKEPGSSNNLPEVLARGNDAPFAGFGQMDRSNQSLPRRNAYIEVKSLKNGSLNLAESLNDGGLPSADYRPAEFVVAVASAGLIGEPVLVTSSEKDDVDIKLRYYLVNIYRLGERLAPGRYVVLIGP